MEESLLFAVHWLLDLLALPSVGLSAIFAVSLISATLLPLGSEPAVFGYIKLSPDMFWAAILVATVGNTIGGAISYAMGLGAEKAVHRWKEDRAPTPHPPGGLAAPQGGAFPLGRPGGERHLAVEQTHPDATADGRMRGRWNERAHAWIHRMGPPALLLSWLPVVGDPLCAVAGWLRLPFWPCVAYMAIGKFLRYLAMTASLLWLFPGQL
ncbi:Inner membrane protein YqaA [Achromobacter deleyi]|uniref:Inner membrane protein YqaA n=1 Tax=Achromobacter deleyi TaxID=1353891 RepID=A0A6S6ZF36_9BURK|nr:YqaA family protein [Achromobacter deleyi]CAB3675558.1 Inner membrane protein YqaA [Achromobacter deleyi]CAB3838122.1 Inner membrane protein YqaA [Achromobacter deleyi]CAB3841843.1 Inner membrane protein YqaA [Achromobacter deleyi]CAB3874652.1 Inner membrane protein YqaA [Achromobacter deleyi]